MTLMETLLARHFQKELVIGGGGAYSSDVIPLVSGITARARYIEK